MGLGVSPPPCCNRQVWAKHLRAAHPTDGSAPSGPLVGVKHIIRCVPTRVRTRTHTPHTHTLHQVWRQWRPSAQLSATVLGVLRLVNLRRDLGDAHALPSARLEQARLPCESGRKPNLFCDCRCDGLFGRLKPLFARYETATNGAGAQDAAGYAALINDARRQTAGTKAPKFQIEHRGICI